MRGLFSSILIPFVTLTACSSGPVSPNSTTPSVIPSPPSVALTIYFTNLANFQVGTEPYEKAVTRIVPTPPSLQEAVLEQLFLGPTADEKAQGLDVFLSGATGFSKLTIGDGVAHVYLTGNCDSKGATYTIANLIDANLKQFAEVKWVKIYDQNGETETPAGQSGSIPFCLEP
jgi:hypothetical protein